MKWLKDWWTEKERLRKELATAQRRLADAERLLKDAQEAEESHCSTAGKAMRENWELQDEIKRLRAPRVVKVPERAMKEAELLDALAVAPDNGLWRAVHQLLDEQIADAVDLVAKRPEPDPRSGVVAVTPDTRNFHAGGIEHLRDFQARLLDWQAKAAKADAAEESAEG